MSRSNEWRDHRAASSVLANFVPAEEVERVYDEARQRVVDMCATFDVTPPESYRIRLDVRGFISVADGLGEVKGLTRVRVSVLLEQLKTGSSINEALLTEVPSIYDLVREYLATQGITDRNSYDKVMFGRSLPEIKRSGPNAKNHVGNCGIRGLFPWNLMQLVLRRPLRGKNPRIQDITEAGDLLFGKLPT